LETDRLRDPPAQLGRVDVEPDQEQVEDQAEVGDDADDRHDVGGEDGGLEIGEEGAEQGRAERDPGGDLAHDARLAQPDRDPATSARDEHDDGDGEEELRDGVGEGALAGGGDRLRADAEGE
jgi:hypothetical protein